MWTEDLLALVGVGDLLLEGGDLGVLAVALVEGQQLLGLVDIDFVVASQVAAVDLDISLLKESIEAESTHTHSSNAHDADKWENLRELLKGLHAEAIGLDLVGGHDVELWAEWAGWACCAC